MLPYRDSKLTKILITIFFLAVAVYAFFELRGFLYGPRISVPAEGIESAEQFIVIKGTAERISSLRMNGGPITVTEDGAFEEPYLLAPGLNRIVFDAEDKYGRRRSTVVQVLYTGEGQGLAIPPSQTSATTSATTSAPIAPVGR